MLQSLIIRRLAPSVADANEYAHTMAYPKKLSAYMAYSTAHREDAKAALIASGNEKPTMGDVAKHISAKWNALSDEEKAVRDACDVILVPRLVVCSKSRDSARGDGKAASGAATDGAHV